MQRARLVLALASMIVAACDRQPEPNPGAPKDPAPAMSNPSAGAPTPTSMAAAPELTWTAPAGWEKAATPGPMRKATYKVPGKPGDDRGAEVSVSQAGGSVMDNTKRWAGQMIGSDKTLKQHEKKVGPYAVTIVEMAGQYQGSMMPNAPTVTAIPDTVFVGAIIELGNGQSLFFKMVGSTAAVTAARPDFDKMVDSVH